MGRSGLAERPRILVVEDDEEIRSVVQAVLTDEGCEVHVAATGEQALDLLATWRPEVILLDLMLPGMDARAFRAEQLARRLAPEANIVVMSASNNVQAVAAELEAFAAIAKPFDLDELVTAVGRASSDR